MKTFLATTGVGAAAQKKKKNSCIGTPQGIVSTATHKGLRRVTHKKKNLYLRGVQVLRLWSLFDSSPHHFLLFFANSFFSDSFLGFGLLLSVFSNAQDAFLLYPVLDVLTLRCCWGCGEFFLVLNLLLLVLKLKIAKKHYQEKTSPWKNVLCEDDICEDPRGTELGKRCFWRPFFFGNSINMVFQNRAPKLKSLHLELFVKRKSHLYHENLFCHL